jgi:hypothetical protein
VVNADSASVVQFVKYSTGGRRRVEREQSATRAVVAAVLAGGLAFSVSLFPLPSDDARLLDLLPPENEISELFAPKGKPTVERLVAVAGTIKLADLVKLTSLMEGNSHALPAYVLPTLVQRYGLPMVVHILELAKANSISPEALPGLHLAAGGEGGAPAVPADSPPALILLLQLLAGVFPQSIDASVWDRVAEALPQFGQFISGLKSQFSAAIPGPTSMAKHPVPLPPPPSLPPAPSESASPPPSAMPSFAPNTWSAPPSAVVTIGESTNYTSVPLEPSTPSFTPTSIPDTYTPEPPSPSPSAPNTPDPTGVNAGIGDGTTEPGVDPDDGVTPDPGPEPHAGSNIDGDPGTGNSDVGNESQNNQSQDGSSDDSGPDPSSGR